jgi:DNA polymerase-3 subunit epsilon
MTAMSTAITRQIVLDTETTGMNQIGAHYEGHKIIEIGAVEVVNRRLTGNNFHVYLKPDRLVDPEAFGVHGIADEFLLDKPTFADVADEFLEYIRALSLSSITHRSISALWIMNSASLIVIFRRRIL